MSNETKPNDALERALIREARDYRASDETRERTLAALGLAVAAPPSFWKMHGLKVFLAAIGVGAVGWFVARPRDEGTLAPVVATVTQATPVVETPAPTPAPTPTVVLAIETAQPIPTIANAPPKLPLRAAATPAPTPSSTLADEIAAIDRVRQAVYANDKDAALVGLDDYDRRFPNGKLAPEAQVLRARARALR